MRVRHTKSTANKVNSHSGQSRAGWLWLAVKSQPVDTKSAITTGAMPSLKARTPKLSLWRWAQRVVV